MYFAAFSLPIVLFLFYEGYASIDIFSLVFIIVFSFFQLIGIHSMMKGVQVGEVSLVSPISASSTVVTVVLSVIFLSEKLSKLRLIGIIFAILGTILISTDLGKIKKNRNTKGVKEAIIALFSFGIYLFIIGFVSKGLTIVSLIATTRIITSAYVCIFAWMKKGVIKISEYKQFKWKFISLFLLYNFGFWGYQIGVSLDQVSLVAPVSSLNPAITIFLAVIFLKEKLITNQKFGVLFVLSGLFMLGLG